MLNHYRAALSRAPFGLALLASVVILFTPASGVPSAPPGTDKLVHLALFAALASTGLLAGLATRPLLLCLAGYAAVSEVAQALLPLGRSGDLLDAAVDLAGLLLGWWLARAAPHR